LAIFEELFFVEFVYPLANFAHEYKKAPKIYFPDLGIRNELIRLRELPADSNQFGPLVENFIFAQLKRFIIYKKELKLNYWQDYNKNEVDFVLSAAGRMISLEVKYQKGQKEKLSVGIVNFIKKYKPLVHITVTYDYFGALKLDGCQVYFIPAYVFGLLI
jgi:hypothetical protein